MNNIVWSTHGRPPEDSCKMESIHDCVYPRKWSRFEYFSLAVFVSITVFSFFVIIYYFKRREWAALLRGPNKLFLTETDLTFGKHANGLQNEDSGVNSGKKEESSNRWVALGMEDDYSVATLKGDHVFLKKLCLTSVDMRGGARKQILHQLRSLHHHNIIQFYGLFTTKDFHYLVMDYACRGTLYDMIINWNATLNIAIKLSLIQDLVKGMKYIHSSPIHCHGRLKSTNCVVDSRFALKVTDYGVNKFTFISENELCITETSKDLLWTAPELLRDANLRRKGSQKGDSFSFAIICQEVLMCEKPYATLNLSSEEIIEKLKNSTPQLRPVVSSLELGEEILQIIKQCWQEVPELRMTFSAIYAELKNMTHNEKCNMVECMMKQLEDNSDQLQRLVNERTMQLQEEKKKTEQLVMKMLPPSIARLLMTNQRIIPELFEKSTIYFSDICGFTTISHSSTPMQVVEFLNSLYTCFDEIIGRYEVYKVETIGDAYMVSSGIPKVIGDRHASEAAMMALDIMSATTTFRIEHLPELQLRIRIGMHSGPAVAGVVGLTTPRYCLFGDTINTASRLETTGIPSRIHISCDTKLSLDASSKKFHLQERGKIELKGRGAMVTYWLLGMEGFNKPLPDPGSLTEPSHGISKDKLGKNTSTNNSNLFSINKPSALRTPPAKHFDKVVTVPPVRKGSSFLISTPLIFLPPSNFTCKSASAIPDPPKKPINSRKSKMFKNSSVSPESSLNSIT